MYAELPCCHPRLFADDGVDRSALSVDQRAPFHDPGTHVIDVEPGPDSRLDQRHLLGADGRLAPEVVEKVLSPAKERPSGQGPAVDGLEFSDLHPGP